MKNPENDNTGMRRTRYTKNPFMIYPVDAYYNNLYV